MSNFFHNNSIFDNCHALDARAGRSGLKVRFVLHRLLLGLLLLRSCAATQYFFGLLLHLSKRIAVAPAAVGAVKRNARHDQKSDHEKPADHGQQQNPQADNACYDTAEARKVTMGLTGRPLM